MDLTKLMLTPLMDDAGDGGTGGTETGDNSQTPAGGGPAGKTNDQNAGGDKGGKPGAPAGDKGGEDPRVRGLLADLQKERTARQRFEADLKARNAEYEREQKRVRALAGLEEQDPEAAKDEAIRARLIKVIPGLAKLTDEKIDKLIANLDKADEVEQTANHYWEQHSTQMIGRAQEAVSDLIGGGKLTERQQGRVARAYAQFVAEDNTEVRAQRHSRGDAKLLEEFAKEFVEDWVKPGQRQALRQETGRQRPVPNGGRGRQDTGSGIDKSKIDWKNPKAVEDAMVASFKEHGGEFGN
jgi:hypothetical protein